MALRRRQGMGRSATFKDEAFHPPREASGVATPPPPPPHSTSSSLAAQAIMASTAHRDTSFKDHFNKGGGGGGPTYDHYASMDGSNEAGSFWGVLARKAKAILDDDSTVPVPNNHSSSDYLIHPTPPPKPLHSSRLDLNHQVEMNSKKAENPTIRKGLDALTTSMNRIGDSIGNALEEGRTIVENKTADFIQETRKIQITRKGSNEGYNGTPMQSYTSQEDLLKASRDVAMATAAKAKLLLRELKTVKADLAFAKQRCSQLEEESKILREAREKGVFPADDDMIRLQLETLLAEKARLAHENSIYARENRFLREIVEYHQLTMQDVVYLDEGIEEVTEVYPVSRMLSVSPPGGSPARSRSSSVSRSSSIAREMMALSMNNNNNNNFNYDDAPSAN